MDPSLTHKLPVRTRGQGLKGQGQGLSVRVSGVRVRVSGVLGLTNQGLRGQGSELLQQVLNSFWLSIVYPRGKSEFLVLSALASVSLQVVKVKLPGRAAASKH